MQRDAYNAYLNSFDALIAKLENPGLSRTFRQGVENGLRVEEIAHYHTLSVDTVQNDLDVLAEIQVLTNKFNKGE